MTEAMRRAVTELVGMIEPTAFGLSIQPLKKRSSSSNLSAKALRNSDTRAIATPDCVLGRLLSTCVAQGK